MKKLLISTAFTLFLLPAAAFCADTAAKAAPPEQYPDNTTQKDINLQACNKMKRADKDVDDLYNSIVKSYSYDPVFIKYLKETQKVWIAYRDARMQALYPPEYHQAYGSSITYCQCTSQTKLDEERMTELEQWAGSKGDYTGTTCAGTRR